ncbi:hypothetical protein Ddc_12817 [Ditylenchus destructor]|nr:hypothetical protein Ddc_12817 [Ditylenchus destructor]
MPTRKRHPSIYGMWYGAHTIISRRRRAVVTWTALLPCLEDDPGNRRDPREQPGFPPVGSAWELTTR